MTKDGIREKVGNDLRRAYDHVLNERIPDDIKRLLDRLS